MSAQPLPLSRHDGTDRRGLLSPRAHPVGNGGDSRQHVGAPRRARDPLHNLAALVEQEHRRRPEHVEPPNEVEPQFGVDLDVIHALKVGCDPTEHAPRNAAGLADQRRELQECCAAAEISSDIRGGEQLAGPLRTDSALVAPPQHAEQRRDGKHRNHDHHCHRHNSCQHQPGRIRSHGSARPVTAAVSPAARWERRRIGAVDSNLGLPPASAAETGHLLPVLQVLLVEDDPADALLAQEYLDGSIPAVDWVRSVAEACDFLKRFHVDCVLLDLNLPDTVGFDGLDRVQAAAPDVAVIVLTGDGDGQRGIGAVSRGAQDFLVKNQVDGPLLTRSIRYAAERKRTEFSLQELRAASIRQEENSRLQRGLLPVPLLSDASAVSVVTRYRPGRAQAQLGGDFYDVVDMGDGRVWVLIGDVCGHGPDEAALGVCLRVGWRAVVLAQLDADAVLPAVQLLLTRERHDEEVFASVCMIVIEPGATTAKVFLAGHPAPLLTRAGTVGELTVESGVALGILDDATWTGVEVELGNSWSLLCFTDGLIEGFDGAPARLGEQGLIEFVEAAGGADLDGDVDLLLDTVIDGVTDRNGGPLVDDLAIVHVRRTRQ
jgi:serine phosphatase RsbU (regulator of sigma subunit)